MQISEFVEATAKIETYYGKDYTTEQRQIMFEELEDLDIERYRKLISTVLKACRYMPKIADFVEANRDLPYEEKTIDEVVECDICKTTGYVSFTKVYGKLEYVFACRCCCANGLNKSKDVPTYQELGIRPNQKIYVKGDIFDE